MMNNFPMKNYNGLKIQREIFQKILYEYNS